MLIQTQASGPFQTLAILTKQQKKIVSTSEGGGVLNQVVEGVECYIHTEIES